MYFLTYTEPKHFVHVSKIMTHETRNGNVRAKLKANHITTC